MKRKGTRRDETRRARGRSRGHSNSAIRRRAGEWKSRTGENEPSNRSRSEERHRRCRLRRRRRRRRRRLCKLMLELVLDKRAFPPFESLLNCILYFLLDKKNEGFLVLRVLLANGRRGTRPILSRTTMLMSMLNREERKWYSTMGGEAGEEEGPDQRNGYYLCSWWWKGSAKWGWSR